MSAHLFAAALLLTGLAAQPAKEAAPAAPTKTKPEAAKAAPAKPAAPPAKAEAPARKLVVPEAPAIPKSEARPEALKDAEVALLGPCPAEFATGKVTALEVLTGEELNALRREEKSTKPPANPLQRFLKVTYEVGGKSAVAVRQISTQYSLTTAQAQKLIGAKLCPVKE